MNEQQLFYQIQLTLIPNVGDVLARNLVSYCGSIENIFKKNAHLEKVPGIGPVIAKNIKEFRDEKLVEDEIEFIQKHNITPLFYLDEKYPARLKNYQDSPILLYYKGNADLNSSRMVAVVGTRKATEYGKDWTEKFVSAITPYNVTVVSGLAFGIDIAAHKASLKNNLPTIGVLGHSFKTIYPAQHKTVSERMQEQGGLLTEFPVSANFDKENFPKRNRIVAGMTDAIIIVESGARGGALITAEIANSYNKDVFAVPGRVNDEFSAGCNYLIKQNKAMLLESATDLALLLGWENKKTKPSALRPLFIELEESEVPIVELLKSKDSLLIDDIALQINYPSSQLAAALLNLEFKGVIKSLPGKVYKLVN